MARDRSLDIAVTGVAARFPGFTSIAGWWSALREGRVLTTRYERSELIGAGVPAELVDDPDYVPVRGHLADAERFDYAFFRISGRDAEMMDPQHRLLLEVAWTALDDAGSASLLTDGSKTGVFASSSDSGYLRAMLANGKLDPPTLDQVIHGTEPDFMASRIAYKLGLTGPALSVRTACSSSLVGVHLAIQALLNGECDEAVVIGSGIGYPQAGHLYIPGGVLSRSGHCRPFDEGADGVVAGSGVAGVVLRRLEDAVQDGLEPYGVVLGTAINNDGGAKAGYFAPSLPGQESVIRAAAEAADVGGRDLGYLETHGTGTQVGDPIEWAAASVALDALGAEPGQVAVGALKANIGHTDAASGIASMIKALLVVRDGVIPPVAGFTRLNPLLNVEDSPLFVPTETRHWTGQRPRRAGISSFGIGGTNAHVIIEQPPERTVVRSTGEKRGKLLVLSAPDADVLACSAELLGEHLRTHDRDVDDVAFTLATGRVALSERLAVPARSSSEAVERLASGTGVVRGRRPKEGPDPVVFAFPGQGSQYPGMALPFSEVLPGFTDALEDCLAAFTPALSDRVRVAVLDRTFPASELAATDLAQPALFAVEFAAAKALFELGVVPVAFVGHSLGEVTAVCVAGALELDDAARFVTARGRAMQDCPPGALLVLGCDEAATLTLVAEAGMDLELATVNSPENCVVAGDPGTVEKFQSWLGDRCFSRRLGSTRGFHSALIEPAVEVLAESMASIAMGRLAAPFATNLTGDIIPAGAEITGDLLVEQARRPVRFADAMTAIAEHAPGLVIEVGPGRTLTSLANAMDLHAVASSPARTADDRDEALAALGTLWTLGQPIDPVVLGGEGHRIRLFGRPFAGPQVVAPEAAPKNVVAPESGNQDCDGESPIPGSGIDATPPESHEDSVIKVATEVPAVLARLWTEVLGSEEPSPTADFFELGGDSMLVTHLARKIKKIWGVKVPLRSLLSERSLERQSELIVELLRPNGIQ